MVRVYLLVAVHLTIPLRTYTSDIENIFQHHYYLEIFFATEIQNFLYFSTWELYLVSAKSVDLWSNTIIMEIPSS